MRRYCSHRWSLKGGAGIVLNPGIFLIKVFSQVFVRAIHELPLLLNAFYRESVLAFFFLPLIVLPLQAQWLESTEDWVMVHHHQADAANVQAILEAVYLSYNDISSNLGLQFHGKLEIYLAGKPAEFGELTDWKLPVWSQGVALTDKKMVVLKSPRYSGSKINLSKAAVHEFIHIFLASEVGRIPLWMNEGLAVMLSGEGYFDDAALSSASMTGKFIPFREMEQVLRFSPAEAQLAYQQALAVTRYWVTQFGWSSVQKFLWSVKAGDDWDHAFLQATGLWLDEFENEWLKKAGGRYKYSALKDLNFFFSWVFVPLIILGGVFAYFRRRRIVKKWKQEEEFFDYGDY